MTQEHETTNDAPIEAKRTSQHRLVEIEYSIPMIVLALLNEDDEIIAQGIPEPAAATELISATCVTEGREEDIELDEEWTGYVNVLAHTPTGHQEMERGEGFIIQRIPEDVEGSPDGEHVYPVFWRDGEFTCKRIGRVVYDKEDEAWRFDIDSPETFRFHPHGDYWEEKIDTAAAEVVPAWES